MDAPGLPAWFQPVSILLDRYGYPTFVTFVLFIIMWKFFSKLLANQERTLVLLEKIITKLNLDKEK